MLRMHESDSEDEEPAHWKVCEPPNKTEETMEEHLGPPRLNLADFLAQQEQNSKSHIVYEAGPSLFTGSDRDLWAKVESDDSWVQMEMNQQIAAAVEDYGAAVAEELLGEHISRDHRLFDDAPPPKTPEARNSEQMDEKRTTFIYAGDLDEKLAQTIEKYSLEVDSEEDEIGAAYNRLLSLALFEAKTLIEDILNSWLVFYSRYYGIFLDMSLDNFSPMVEFVMAEVQSQNVKLNSESSSRLLEIKNRFLQVISARIGLFLLFLSKTFKQEAKACLKHLENGLSTIACQTNLLAMYELSNLKHRLTKLEERISTAWFLHAYAKKDLIGDWLKCLFERLFSADNITLDSDSKTLFDKLESNYNTDIEPPSAPQKAPKPTQAKPQKPSAQDKALSDLHTPESQPPTPRPPRKAVPPAGTKLKPQTPNTIETDTRPAAAPVLLGELLPSVPSSWLSVCPAPSPDHAHVGRFLGERPEVQEIRKTAAASRIERLLGEEVLEEMYLVGQGGRRAIGVRIKGRKSAAGGAGEAEERVVVIEKDAEGNNIAKDAGDCEWFQVDQSFVQTSNKAIDLLSSKPSALPSTTGIYVSGALLMAGSGAIGNFLFRLVQGKQKTSELSKDLAKDAGMSVALTVFVSFMPHLAIAVGSVLGVKAMVNLQKNKLIKRSKKIFIITDILARTGAKTACAVGGAITGQSLIPVPFLGAFVGGVIGGFAATAVLSSYDSLVAKRISLEQLAFYCLMELSTNHGWKPYTSEKGTHAMWMLDDHHAQTAGTGEKLHGFLVIITPLLSREVLQDKFLEDLRKKDGAIQDLMDEMFASIAFQSSPSEDIDEDFHFRWRSTLAVGFLNHYNYLAITQLEKVRRSASLQRSGHLETPLPHADSLESFFLTTCKVLDGLPAGISLADEYRAADRIVLLINQMLSQEKLVTLFKRV